MANGEEEKLHRLEQRLSRARLDRRRAEQEHNALERQAGFGGPPRKLRAVLDRAQRRLEKCQQLEADLERQIDELKHPVSESPLGDSSSESPAAGDSAQPPTGATPEQSPANEGDEGPA